MMMDYERFKVIAEHINEINRGKFTEEEVNGFTEDYCTEYEISMTFGKPTTSMITLCTLLVEDMDWQDYVEQDNYLDIETMSCLLEDSCWELMN